MEERRMRTDDSAQALLNEALMATAYQTSGYHHPVIGWMNDIKAMTGPVLAHRLILRPEFEIEGLSVGEVIQNIVQQIAVPR